MSVSEKNAISLADLPACPVETTLTLISDKWKVLILRDLMPGLSLIHILHDAEHWRLLSE